MGSEARAHNETAVFAQLSHDDKWKRLHQQPRGCRRLAGAEPWLLLAQGPPFNPQCFCQRLITCLGCRGQPKARVTADPHALHRANSRALEATERRKRCAWLRGEGYFSFSWRVGDGFSESQVHASTGSWGGAPAFACSARPLPTKQPRLCGGDKK